MSNSLRSTPTQGIQQQQRLSCFSSSFFTFLAIFFLVSCTVADKHPDLTDDKDVLIREWTRQTHGEFLAGDRGNEYSNPILYENTIVFGNSTSGVTAIYPSLNATKWKLPISNGVVSHIGYADERIFFGGGDGYVYAVNIDNGRILWRYNVRNPVVSKPTLKDGRLFVTTSDDTIYAFDAGTGQWLWHYRRRSAQTATIMGASSPLVSGTEVIAGLSDGFLVGLDLNDGTLKWERKLHLGRKFTDIDAEPVLDNGVVYIPSYDGSLYALRKKDR